VVHRPAARAQIQAGVQTVVSTGAAKLLRPLTR
jgi:hypothetical protein